MRSFLSTEIDVTSPSTQLLGICGQFRSTSNLGACGGDWAPSPIDAAVITKAADAASRKYFMVLFSPRFGSTLRRPLCLCPEGEQVIEQSVRPFVLGEVSLCSRVPHRTLAVLVIVG